MRGGIVDSTSGEPWIGYDWRDHAFHMGLSPSVMSRISKGIRRMTVMEVTLSTKASTRRIWSGSDKS